MGAGAVCWHPARQCIMVDMAAVSVIIGTPEGTINGPLEYETFTHRGENVQLQCYDRDGASVVIEIDKDSLFEAACGAVVEDEPR